MKPVGFILMLSLSKHEDGRARAPSPFDTLRATTASI